MRKISEVLRLEQAGCTIRQIARVCGIGRSTVTKYLERAAVAGFAWPLPADISEAEIEHRLFGERTHVPRRGSRPAPDWARVHDELQEHRNVTLRLLWEEYKKAEPGGYQYSRFCDQYRSWACRLDRCMRQEHVAGEKVFVDYAGDSLCVIDRDSGERRKAYLFVSVLGCSNYTYAQATWTQQLPDWIGAHVRMFGFYGGVTQQTVPDNPKTAVLRACRYDPDLNPTYAEWASHYGTAVIPARRRRPKDKAKVEVGVLLAERWIIAVLRHRVFYSLAELNVAIRELLEKLNLRPFQKLPGTRRERFERLEQATLMPLPATAYEYAEWRQAGVNIDYHVEVERHYYSVPHELVKHRIWVRLTAGQVEFFHQNQRVAAHVRSHQAGGYTTVPEHRPKSHREHLAWPSERILEWVGKSGNACRSVAEQILKNKPFAEQGYRACLGLIRLGQAFGVERLEAACRRAEYYHIASYRSVRSILEQQLDREPLPGEMEERTIINDADHVRGSTYYQRMEESHVV